MHNASLVCGLREYHGIQSLSGLHVAEVGCYLPALLYVLVAEMNVPIALSP